MVTVPVFSSFEQNASIVGHYFAIVPWYVYFQEELPNGTAPLLAVVETSCGHEFSFQVEGRNATLLSTEHDVHDPLYDDMYVSDSFMTFTHDTCDFNLGEFDSLFSFTLLILLLLYLDMISYTTLLF